MTRVRPTVSPMTRIRRAASLFAALSALSPVTHAAGQGAQTGLYTARFTEHSPESNMGAILKRTRFKPTERWHDGNHYKIDGESFHVYVPQSYTGNEPYGLIVWIPPGDEGGIPLGWNWTLDKYKLIWVGADKSGNDRSVYQRRIPLALDGLHNVVKTYKVDPNRVYLAGFSGGSRIASMVALHYSDIFAGAVFICGMDHWEDMPVPGQQNFVWKAVFPKPESEYFNSARRDGRYVLVTGENDENRPQMEAIYRYLYKSRMRHSLYIEVPKMGHEAPPTATFDQAIVFLDTNGEKPEAAGPAASRAPVAAAGAAGGVLHAWTYMGRQVEATFVKRAGPFVILKKADGSELKVREGSLSDTDREYLRGSGN